jgi:hypothetical protein
MLFDLMQASTYNPAFVTAQGGTIAAAEAIWGDTGILISRPGARDLGDDAAWLSRPGLGVSSITVEDDVRVNDRPAKADGGK